MDHRELTDIVIAAHFLSLGNLKNLPRLSPKIVCFLLALINRAPLFVIVTWSRGRDISPATVTDIVSSAAAPVARPTQTAAYREKSSNKGEQENYKNGPLFVLAVGGSAGAVDDRRDQEDEIWLESELRYLSGPAEYG